MAGITGIQYKEVDGLQFPVLEGTMGEAEVMAALGRYGRMAARDLQESDPDRYGMLLLTGMLLPKMQEVQEQAEALHDSIAENLVKAWMAQENVDPYNTMRMAGLRTQAEMEAEEEVIREVIHQPR